MMKIDWIIKKVKNTEYYLSHHADEERKNDNEMIEILKGLENEFEIELDRLEWFAVLYDSLVIRSSRIFYPTTNDVLPTSYMKAGIASVIWAGTFDSGAGALESLIASGKIEFIKNKELRTSLANWNTIIEIPDEFYN